MHPEWSPENESSSCTASPDGVTPVCSQHSPGSFTSASTMKNAKNCSAETGANDLDPLVSETSTSLELQGMVQPEVRSVSPSFGCTKPSQRHKKVHSASGMSNRLMHSNDRKGPKDQAPVAEEERRKIKRERNKIAAAKCRNRRRDLTDTLQAETEELEENKAALQTEIASLLSEKEKLEEILASRKSTCKQPEDDDDIAYLRHDSLQYLSVIENTQIIEGNTTTESSIVQDIDVPPNISASAIQGNSNILFCPAVKEESMEGLKRLELDELGPSLEIAVAPDTAPSVPDIDLGGPFCLSDWDTLYKCVANDIGTQVLSSSPESSNYCTAFSFNYSEIDIADNCEGFKGGLVKSEMQKIFLDSPTLLSL